MFATLATPKLNRDANQRVGSNEAGLAPATCAVSSAFAPPKARSCVYRCGPFGFKKAAATASHAFGSKSGRIRRSLFSVAPFASPGGRSAEQALMFRANPPEINSQCLPDHRVRSMLRAELMRNDPFTPCCLHILTARPVLDL